MNSTPFSLVVSLLLLIVVVVFNSDELLLLEYLKACRASQWKRSILRAHVTRWRKIARYISNPVARSRILRSLSEGLDVQLSNAEIQDLPRNPTNVARTQEHKRAVTEYFLKGLRKGHFIAAPSEFAANVARILVVPKDITDFRVCTDFTFAPDGTSVNKRLPRHAIKTKFPNLFDLVLRAVRVGPGGTVQAMDGKSYYRQFEIRDCDRILFGYRWLGVTLLDGRLPFGISNATQHVQIVSNAVIEIFEKVFLPDRVDLHGLTVAYIDDFAQFSSSIEDAKLMVDRFQQCCDYLGVQLGPSKFKPPAPSNKVLGFIFDLPNQCIHIPAEKIIKAKERIRDALLFPVTRKQLERLVGFLQWISQVAFPLKSMLKPLRNDISSAPLSKHELFDVSPTSRRSLIWFLRTIDELNSCPFDVILGKDHLRTVHVFSDASDLGLGFWSESHYFFSSWRALPFPFNQFEFLPIHAREMIAALATVFVDNDELFHNTCVHFWLDNKIAHSAIIKLHSRNDDLNAMIRVLARRAVQCKFRFYTHWLSSHDNHIADKLSRLQISEALLLFNDNNPDLTEPDWSHLWACLLRES